jgi:ComF family protein
VARALLDLLLPPCCVACGDPLVTRDPDAVICGGCRVRLAPLPPPRCSRCDMPMGTGRTAGHPCRECADWPGALMQGWAATAMTAPAAQRLVHALKYDGWRKAARPMAEVMAARIPSLPLDAIFVPVPTTMDRVRRRGFNQASLLARELARICSRPVADALERTGGGPSQVSLHPSQRRTNVKDVFEAGLAEGPNIVGHPVILVDDVLTTGATACAAARVLGYAGASGVTVLVFARAIPDPDGSPHPS